jgi:nucleotide-binding universal stress UspA family protein
MAIRKILLPMIGTEAGEAALDLALRAALLWGAHLTALHVRADSRDVMQVAAEGLSGALIEQMMQAADREAARRADAVRALFDRFVERHAVVVAPPSPGPPSPTAWFATETGRDEDVVAQQARLADLTVLARPDPSEDVATSDALHAVLFDSGRPVLIAPPAAPQTVGRRICLAWSGTAEAAAAARSGIVWMKRAERVTILTSRDYQRRGPSAAALADYLALHGIEANVAPFVPVPQGPGPGLLHAASDHDADLLIMGAYSSSRLRQLILGGTTRHVLENAVLPVMMSR